MLKSRYFCGGSVVAVALALGLSQTAVAQTVKSATTAAAAPKAPEVSELVVTGSLIQGSRLDAALPVEVYSQNELEKQGSPSALEFAKTLTIAGPTTGEAYYFSGVAPGVVSYNLRGIGSDKTLILLNGRRVSQNATNIPQIALSRTEILKDGAAVTYGADAIGGVVNFITRDHYVGLETSGQYKYIKGSDGDYSLGVLAGVGEGDVNLLVSAEYEHRSRLNTLDRDFARTSLDPTNPGYNPAPWSTLTNLAGWLPRGALPTTPSSLGSSGIGEWGAPSGGIVSDFTPASCAAVGGRYDNSFTCAYNYLSYYNLVEENNIYRAYAQLNAKVTDSMKAHFEVAYGQVDSPQIFGSPAQPVTQGPAMATGATYQFYVPITNPYAAAFAASHNAPASTQGFTPVTYRVFAHGGNPFFGEGNGFGVPSRYNSQTFRVSGGLKGDLGDFGPLTAVRYDANLTYNHSEVYADSPDVIGYRLQEALYGFGGPNCHATDNNPARFGTQNTAAAGKNGCLYWNPFATNFAKQPNLGLTNPNFQAGTENPAELAHWLFDDRASETTSQNLTFDFVLNGQSKLTLPGGDVGWAVGAQARSLEERVRVPSDIYNGSLGCPWPAPYTSANGAGSPNIEAHPANTTDANYRGCTAGDGQGPFTFFGTLHPTFLDQQQYSLFGELQIPVLESLSFQLAARHEEFSHDLKTTVYKVAGRWNVWGPLTVRGSYGTNYQAPPLSVIPGQITNAVRSYTIAAGNWLGAQFVTDANLKPATAKTWNAGVIWQSRGFADDHDLRIILDYFDIRTKDEISVLGGIADVNDIANLVFNGAGGTITTCDPSVQPLLNRVTFNNGCTIGMGAVGTFSQIRTITGNGPGQTTTGYDLQSTYHLPLGPGDLTLGLNATYITALRTGPTSLDGVVISTGDDRLGKLNFATVAAAAPKLRANLSANYAMGPHNFRLGVDYVSKVTDERPGIQYGETGEAWVSVDLTYRVLFRDNLTLTATVGNLFDRDPPAAQEELGYDPRLGNPLGRTFEIGLKKTF